jgi:HAD superfamily hydrolase (TIGR01490 family)
MKPVIAAFDFDGTITTRDMLLPFLCQLHTRYENILYSIKLIPTLFAYKLKLINNQTAKQKLLSEFINNFSITDLTRIAENFAKTTIPVYIRPEALERIRWHQAQNHRCILISAGLEIYLKPWAETIGFTDIIATQIEFIAEKTQGKIKNQNCFGPEKVRRLLELVGPREHFILYAYGDSRGDQELLATADYSFYQRMSE